MSLVDDLLSARKKLLADKIKQDRHLSFIEQMLREEGWKLPPVDVAAQTNNKLELHLDKPETTVYVDPEGKPVEKPTEIPLSQTPISTVQKFNYAELLDWAFSLAGDNVSASTLAQVVFNKNAKPGTSEGTITHMFREKLMRENGKKYVCNTSMRPYTWSRK